MLCFSFGLLVQRFALVEYLPILIFLALSIVISLVMIILPFIVSKTVGGKEKLSSYECGFVAFDDSRAQFDIRFYLVAILFLIFDLEIAFLFPWSIVLTQLGVFGYCSMMFFLALLTIGFVYEWKKGALEWK